MSMAAHHIRRDVFNNGTFNRTASDKNLPRFFGRRLRNHGTTIGFNIDDTQHGQTLQGNLDMIAVGVEGINNLRLDQPATRT